MIKKMSAVMAMVAICVLTLSGCGGKKIATIKDVTSTELQFQGVKSGDTIATIKTDMGDIKAILYPKLAPLAVENFVTHAQEGYFDGLIFHRVIKDFMIQSGDPLGTSKGGESIWDLPFSDEFSDQLHHYSGALSMANSGSNSNRSQFFIVTENAGELKSDVMELLKNAQWRDSVIDTYKQSGGAPHLDYRHSVFGQIYEGLDIAFAISDVKTDENDKPKQDIIIQTIEISIAE